MQLMKSALFVSMFLLLTSMALQAQTNPQTPASSTPDKSWVLKEFPNATDIRWHEEKNGHVEFEFVNDRKETTMCFDKTGQVLKTKEECGKKCSKKGNCCKKESEDDDKDRK